MVGQPLTAKQQNFVTNILSGMTQADAYRSAYDAENMNDNSLYVQASELAVNPKVAVSIQEGKQVLAERTTWTLEGILKAAEENWKGAQAAGAWAAANGALAFIGKVTGLVRDTPPETQPINITKVTVVLDRGDQAKVTEGQGRIVPDDADASKQGRGN